MPEEGESRLTSVAVSFDDKALLDQIRDDFQPRPTIVETLGWIIREEYGRRFPKAKPPARAAKATS